MSTRHVKRIVPHMAVALKHKMQVKHTTTTHMQHNKQADNNNNKAYSTHLPEDADDDADVVERARELNDDETVRRLDVAVRPGS
jgi:hypothetical protein